MKTFKEFLYEKYPLDYSDGRNVRPPAEPASPMGATHYSVYSDEADDREAKRWADELIGAATGITPSPSMDSMRQSVMIVWQSIQTELNFNSIKELIFTALENHEHTNAATAVLRIIRPDQDVSGGDIAVLSQ